MIDSATIQTLIIGAAWAVPLVTGIVEVVKRTFPSMDSRYLPGISVLAGIAIGLLVIQLSIAGAIVGLVIGLGATGLWEFGKTTIAGK